MIAISCRDLVKTYPGRPPVEAVRGLNLEVHEGECFGLLGPNGAGKTTTIEIIEGLLAATSGEVEVLGHNWSQHRDDIKQKMGISLQETRLTDRLTVLETLRLFRSFYKAGLDPRETMRRVSLEEKANAWVAKLSGGQRQRLAVATALVGDPELVCLDEPTTGLDPQSRRELWEIIRDFRRRGRTVLLTTHYMDEAERLCDRVAIVHRGQVIALGSPAELIGRLEGEHIIEFSTANGAEPSGADSFLDLPAVQTAKRGSGGGYRLAVTAPHIALPAILDRLNAEGRELTSLTTRHASLEDVFVQLTGRTMEDADKDAAQSSEKGGKRKTAAEKKKAAS
jgi:ABC-2 type transport system ATP-binding protein